MVTRLHGYHLSVYTWIARFALVEKGVSYQVVEVNPFDPVLDDAYAELHPFLRVPVLEHEADRLYETAAITQFVDEAFPGPALQPQAALARARMRQVIAVVDAYGYWPLVRQVYTQRVVLPCYGRPVDEAQVAEGLARSARVLRALEALTGLDGVLDRHAVTLADIHLAPMIAYFARAPEGARLIGNHPRLQRWWQWIGGVGAFRQTEPEAPPAR